MLDSTGTDIVSTLDSTDKDDVSMTNDPKSDETGDSTPQASIMMASFRVDRELWAKFGAIAKRERLTATDVLTDYIQRCTDNDKTEYAVSIGTDSTISTDTYDEDKLKEIISTIISTLSLPSKDDVSTLVSTAIDRVSGELNESLAELENYTHQQFRQVREELDKTLPIASEPDDKPTDKDPSVKSWAEFFTMVGIEALKATEAQKKENIDTRTQQAEEGIKAAKEQGLGEWSVKIAGRSFVRVGD